MAPAPGGEGGDHGLLAGARSHRPQGERAERGASENSIEVVEADGRGWLPEPEGQEALVDPVLPLEVGEGALADGLGPEPGHEAAPREPLSRRPGVHHLAVEGPRHRARLVGCVGHDPLREVVDERRLCPREVAEEDGVADEERPDLLGHLEAHVGHGGPDPGVPEGTLEPILGDGPREPVRPHEHPVEAGPAPQRAVGEGAAEGADDRLGVPGEELVDGQPVGDDAARRQARPQQPEVLEGVEVHDPGPVGRRRLSGDQVVAGLRRLQVLPPVLDVDADPRVGQRVPGGRLHHPVHLENVARDVDHVDPLQAGQARERPRGDADAVADEERLAQVRVHGGRPPGVEAHVAAGPEGRARHREPVRDQAVDGGLGGQVAAHVDDRLGRALAHGHDPAAVAAESLAEDGEVAVLHEAEGEEEEGERVGGDDGQAGDPPGGGEAAGPGEEQGGDAVRRREHGEGAFHAEEGKQEKAPAERPAERPEGVGEGQPPDRARLRPAPAVGVVAEQREGDTGQQRHGQHEAQAEGHDAAGRHRESLQAVDAGERRVGHDDQGARGQESRRQEPGGAGVPPQPGRGHEAAGADAEQHHGQHEDEGQAGADEEQAQEAEPHDLEREQRGAAQEGRAQGAPGDG